LDCFHFGIWLIMLIWTGIYNFYVWSDFILLAVYLWGWLLSHVGTVCWSFWRVCCIPKWLYPFSFHHPCVRVIICPHNFQH
jgi:hypothetical protein